MDYRNEIIRLLGELGYKLNERYKCGYTDKIGHTVTIDDGYVFVFPSKSNKIGKNYIIEKTDGFYNFDDYYRMLTNQVRVLKIKKLRTKKSYFGLRR